MRHFTGISEEKHRANPKPGLVATSSPLPDSGGNLPPPPLTISTQKKIHPFSPPDFFSIDGVLASAAGAAGRGGDRPGGDAPGAAAAAAAAAEGDRDQGLADRVGVRGIARRGDREALHHAPDRPPRARPQGARSGALVPVLDPRPGAGDRREPGAHQGRDHRQGGPDDQHQQSSGLSVRPRPPAPGFHLQLRVSTGKVLGRAETVRLV